MDDTGQAPNAAPRPNQAAAIIARAIYAELRRQADSGGSTAKWTLDAAAEAVARDLGLREEWAPAYWCERDDGSSYVDPDTETYDRREDAQERAWMFDQIVACRYVTDWIADRAAGNQETPHGA